MSLKDLNLKVSYDSDEDDILNEFFVEVLSQSDKYNRVAGFFSSSTLAAAARGISYFIKNNGKMQLICSAKLQKNDLEIIKKAHKNPKTTIEESMIRELDELENLEDKLIKEHVKALGWMIANNKLEIKIAILVDKNGIPLNENQGILHQKIGILEDIDGNKISFSGSNNETATAWKSNIEEFKVFRNWIKNEKKYFEIDEKRFKNFWNNDSKRMKIFDVPLAVKNKLIQIAPDSPNDLDFRPSKIITNTNGEKISLFKYQLDAIRNWEKNNSKGIFEMATGTGKTFTALGCLDDMNEKYEKLLVVITSPFQHLVKQWENEIKKFGIKYDDIIIADSTNPNWKHILTDSMLDISLGNKRFVVVLTTHRTFSSDDFLKIINGNKYETTTFLIGDEVHGVGAEISLNGLTESYDLRLGLSATPKRYFDDPGTDFIYSYFGGVVYKFSLEKAINTKNPATKETYLTRFRYLPKFTCLNQNEIEEYINISRSIAINYNKNKNNEPELLNKLLFKRANIVKNAANKFQILEEIMDDIGNNLKWTIIYCTNEQIDVIMQIINKKGIPSHRFTMKESSKSQKRYGGLSEREAIIEKFADGKFKILVAMKCLDEGVDIPPARTAVLMASSGNPREYIQRIGRILRRYKDKDEAKIHDIIVAPSLRSLPPDLRKLEKKIFEKELKRAEEIATTAVNSAEALDIIHKMEDKYR